MSLLAELLGGSVAVLLGTSTTIGLEKIKTDKGQEYYEKRVKEAYPVVNGFLRELAAGSKTKIDDKSIDAIADAIKMHAALNGIDLPDAE